MRRYVFSSAFVTMLLVSAHLFSINATWNLNANGNWNVNGNWTPATFPNGIDDTANFGNVISANRVISLGAAAQNIVVGTVNFDDNNNYTIQSGLAGNTLIFQTSVGSANIAITNVNGNGNHTISAPMLLNSNLNISSTSTGIFTISGAISGAGSLTKNGTGSLTLSAANSYGGGTNINEGTLTYSANGALPAASTVIIGDGAAPNATLTMATAMTVGNAFNATINSDGTILQNSGASVFLSSLQGSGGITLTNGTGATSFFDVVTSASTTFSGSISGGAASASTDPAAGNRLIKDGTGTLTLTGASTYLSRTFIRNGVLTVQSSTALGSSATNTGVFVQGTVNNGSLYLENIITLGKAIFLNGAGFSATGALRNVTGNNAITGNVRIGWSGGTEVASDATIQVDPGTTLTLSGVVLGTNNLTKTGTGTLVLSGTLANTLTGTVNINAGTVTLSKTAGINAIVGAAQINTGGTLLLNAANQIGNTSIITINGGTFNMNGNADTIGSLVYTSGTFSQGGALLSLNNATPTALTMSDNTTIAGNITFTAAGGVTYNGTTTRANILGNVSLGTTAHTFTIADGADSIDMELSGIISGTGSITKAGAGLLQFSGTSANTYTGTTTINAGELFLNKTAGVNAIGGNVTINGGTLTLGAADQIANTSTMTLAGGIFNMNGNAETISSLLFTSGTLTQGSGTLTLTSNGIALSMGDGTTIIGNIALTGDGNVNYTGTTTQATISGNLDLGSLTHSFTIANGTAATDMEISGVISGTGGITKGSSTGRLVFSGSSGNTYTGLTTVSFGELFLNKSSGNAIGGDITLNDNSGFLVLGASNQIADTSTMILTGGTFDMGIFAETIGTFDMRGGGPLGGFIQGAPTAILSLASTGTALFMEGHPTDVINGEVRILNGGGVRFRNTQNGTAIFSSTSTLDLGSSVTPIEFNISNGTATTDMRISGVITGLGAGLTKIGAGRLDFDGTVANTYTGLTTISNGELFLNKTAGVTAIPGDILINGGTLTLGAADQIADTSVLTLSSGTFNMAGIADTIGTFDFRGGTFNQGASILRLANTGTALSMRNRTITGNIEILNGGSVVFDSTNNGTATISGSLDLGGTVTPINFNIANGTAATDMTISGIITGTGGGLTKTGAGLLELTGASSNTYTGLTTVSAGTLLLNKTAGLNAITGDALINGGAITLGAIDQIPDSSTVTLTAGSFNLAGFTETIDSFVFNAGTYSHGGATLSLASGGTALSMRDTLINGNLSILNGGSVVFDNANNGTAIITGDMNLNGFDTTFDIANGTAAIDMIVGGVINNGAVTKTGDGTLLLTGGNTYSGGTLISAGTLQGNTFSLQNNITDNANLVFDQSSNGTYSGMISGTGNFVKQGLGSLTLSNTNSIGGTATVSSGTLTVNGTLGGGGAMTVASGATLRGTGTITKNATIFGTLAPGNSIGTIHFIGDQILASGSLLEIEFTPTTRDLLDITGSLEIQPGSTIRLIPAMGVYSNNFVYSIVQTTGGIEGTFTTVQSLPLFRVRVEYTPFNIALVRITIIPFAALFRTGNAAAVAHCLDIVPEQPDADNDFVISNLRFMPTVEELHDALLQLQPSAFTSLAIAQENNTLYVKEAIYNHLEEPFRTCCLYKNNGKTFWISPFAAKTFQENHGEEPGFTTESPGIVAGIDFHQQEKSSFGVGVGYNYTDLHWNQKRGRADIQTAYLAAYGQWIGSCGYLQTSLIGGYNNYCTNRHIEFQFIDRNAKGQHKGLEGSLHLKGALTYDYFGATLSPFATADYICLHEDGFKEKGATSLNLNVKSKSSDLLLNEAGINISNCLIYNNNSFTPFVQFSVIRESRCRGNHEKASLGGRCELDVTGLNPSRTLGGIAAGVNTELPSGALSLLYRGRFGRGFKDNAIYLQYECAIK